MATPALFIIGYQFLRQIGSSLSNGPLIMTGMASLEKKNSGIGSSFSNWTNRSVSCLSIAVFSSLLTYRTDVNLAKLQDADLAFTTAVNEVFLISAIVMAISLPFYIFLKPRENS